MKICGIKLTHDAAVAVIEDNKLLFSIEAEKISNNPRYSTISSYEEVERILQLEGLSLADMDKVVVDGWDDGDDAMQNTYELNKQDGVEGTGIMLARYGRNIEGENVFNKEIFSYGDISYSSYTHASGHLLGAYCTSPFSQTNENSYILVWDGGLVPTLFYYHVVTNKMEKVGRLFDLNGDAYRLIALHFEPFNKLNFNDLSIAGKVMAYIAKGKFIENLFQEMVDIYESMDSSDDQTMAYIDEVLKYTKKNGYLGVDVMRTFHHALEYMLVSKLRAAVADKEGYQKNLVFTGGCALNIKWNGSIRKSQIFNKVFVPPFPNDSGSAIGAACCEMVTNSDNKHLKWDVYGGPVFDNGNHVQDWDTLPFSIQDLARLIHVTQEPILFLNGRAELGPRALGNRSILSSPSSPYMKQKLNDIKKREDFRPVAPICMEEHAPDVFNPGCPDPYMLFEHMVIEDWKEKVPAIRHLDNTARLQTINKKQNARVYELLSAFYDLSGIPLLCNTSANLNGSGFFPDIASAIKWGRVPYIWSDGRLYIKEGYNNLEMLLSENLSGNLG